MIFILFLQYRELSEMCLRKGLTERFEDNYILNLKKEFQLKRRSKSLYCSIRY